MDYRILNVRTYVLMRAYTHGGGAHLAGQCLCVVCRTHITEPSALFSTEAARNPIPLADWYLQLYAGHAAESHRTCLVGAAMKPSTDWCLYVQYTQY